MNKVARFHFTLAVILIALGVTPVWADSATLAGVITSDESDSPTIAGALIRTEGEPGYVCTSSSDGAYSMVLPQGNHNVLVSAAGHDPQKVGLSIAGGATTTRNFVLKLSSAGPVLNMPAPLEWGSPPSAPVPPGDSFPVTFADMGGLPSAGVPRISEWNECVKPDETFTMTGAQFTTRSGADAGTDTIVWVWARTSATDGALRQAKIWKVTENTLTATLPDEIPFGMYLIWVENSAGVSSPICVNRTEPRWVGPLGNGVAAGGTKRVFGTNISFNHGTATSYVYIQPAAGGQLTLCTVTAVNPYSVAFTVPIGTPNGDYKVYVHNGHGGVYGWGEGLDLVVRDEWVRGATEISLTPSGGDDTTAIQNAINTLTALPAGGSVRFSAGTFKTYDWFRLKDNVRLVGAGMNQTTIELRQNVQRHDFISYGGTHITLEGLTLKACIDSPTQPPYGILGGDYPVDATYDMKFLNIRVTGDYGTVAINNAWGNTRTEMSGCEFYRAISPGYWDGWVHNCTLYGGPYGIYVPYSFETEAACFIGSRTVFENSHVETKDWLVNPANGSLNYMDWIDSSNWNSILGYKVWAKRVLLTASFGVKHTYTAHLTTKDVAVQDNKGEMCLFHGGGGQWFGNVVSMNGLTMNLLTDGTVNGQPMSIGAAPPNDLKSGQQVPDNNPFWVPLDNSSAIIIAGKGVGQLRQVLSHTSTSITIDKPWRIQPDTTSVILISPTYEDNTIYSNEFNAFPIGYVQGYSASQAVDFDGNACKNSVEANTSHRTNAARNIIGQVGGPSYWNVMRDETAFDCHNYGYGIFFWNYQGDLPNPLGPLVLGNAYRNCAVNIYGSVDYGATRGRGEGTVFEDMTLTAKMGYNLRGVTEPGFWPDGLVLYRNGNVTAVDGAESPAAPEPVYITATDGKQFVAGNSYSGGAANYYLASGLSTYSIPVALYRVAKFTGYAGYPVQDAIIPIANAGITGMTWTATPSDPWITATIPSNSTLGPDTELGKLIVAVDTTGMSTGRHWGNVTISTGVKSVKIGVCVDIVGGVPMNQNPVASLGATPAVGAMPLAVLFNAGASHDSDGLVSSYHWDFGDGTYGSGVTTSHVYTATGTFTTVLTVTDDSGGVDTAWSNTTVVPALTGVSLVGNPPIPPIATGATVTLTATAAGGYQVHYKFLLKTSTGWSTLRDYASGNTCLWTPGVAGYYEVKVWAKNTGSTNTYDVTSSILSYPVGLLPTGAKLWLKADAGISASGGLVSGWTDQSGMGNNVTQNVGSAKPTLAVSSINGRPVVRFSGPGQMLQSTGQVISGNTAFTSFTVARFNQLPAGTYQYFWWNGADGSNTGYGCYLYSSGNIRCAWGGNSGAVTDPSVAATGSLYSICSRFTSSGGTGPHELWVNGSLVSSRGKSGSNLFGGTFTVGNYGPSPGSGLYGDIAEMLIYDRALSDTERASVEQYLASRWVPSAPVSIDRLKDVKALGDGMSVSITSAKTAITASGVYSDGSVYVSDNDRTAGLKLTGAGAMSLGDNLTLAGTTDTDATTGERVLRVTGISKTAGAELVSLGMTNRAFVAAGQLVRAWGRVKEKTSSFITVDDGSGAQVRAQIDGLTIPTTKMVNVGDYISISGPAGLMAGGMPAVRVRSDSDIQVY